MAQSIEESLLRAIKDDDIKSFNILIDNAQCGAYRLGRFPVLSLLYLYKSRKILSACEERLLSYSNFKAVREPVEVSKKFSAKAGKCLRLYLNEVVTPLEMLLILDKTTHLKRLFPKTKPQSAVKDRLKSVYFIKYSLDVGFEGNEIIIARPPLSDRKKKKIAIICMCTALTAAVAVCVPVTTISLIPKPIEGEVFKLSQIDFGSEKKYTLKRDITIPENYSVEKVNCKIVGNGNKMIFGKGANLGVLNGQISDVTIESSGSAIFNMVSATASIDSVTLNVGADITATESTALLAVINYGTIDGVAANISGNISAVASSDGVTEHIIGGIVQNNASSFTAVGQIKNCTVNYSQFELVGEASADASFGGVAGINNGYLTDCIVTGEVVADTFDIAGVCSVNNGLLSGNINEANLSQTSSDTGWNPISCGIVIKNANAIQNCENRGKISAASACDLSEVEEDKRPTVSVAGIAYLNNSSCIIGNSKNSGALTANSESETYVGGIATISYGNIYKTVNDGDITVKSEGHSYVGGILGISNIYYEAYLVYCGNVYNCISNNKFKVDLAGDAHAYVGGIVGYIVEAGFNNQDSVVYFGGSVNDCYFIGESTADGAYFGNIAGVCGANIYETNSYFSNNIEYHNFENNYYTGNSSKAFGKTVTADGDFVSVEDKGATSTTIDDIQNSKEYKEILNASENT